MLAVGTINGESVEVLCSSFNKHLNFTFNGKKDKALERKLREMLSQRQRIGNYSAKTDKLKLCAIFDRSGFFDLPADVKVFGEIERIPTIDDDGVVY